MRFVLPMIILALAAPAAAQTPPADAKPAKAAKEEKICITKAEVGTRFKTRTCYTKAEYERRQLEERQALERTQRVPYKAE
jgi:hypothetical protein